jgi:hypothetical protein
VHDGLHRLFAGDAENGPSLSAGMLGLLAGMRGAALRYRSRDLIEKNILLEK